MRRILICGGSAGLGLAIAKGLPEPSDMVWINSRNAPPLDNASTGVEFCWIGGDLSDPATITNISSIIGEVPLDALIYCSGTWESHPDLAQIDTSEIYHILAVNASAFLALSTKLRNNLVRADNGRIIAIGSTAGLENATGPRAAYAASKFAVRGAVHGLREFFRGAGVGVTVISPGGLASDIDLEQGEAAALSTHDTGRIPSQDILKIIRTILAMSAATDVKEIHLPAMKDNGV